MVVRTAGACGIPPERMRLGTANYSLRCTWGKGAIDWRHEVPHRVSPLSVGRQEGYA